MRIIAGLAKGRQLRSLKGLALRPTSDRMRESLFAMLGTRMEGARLLDLYAGVGTVGLEALSRGAAEVVFVESHWPAARLIEENARLCGFTEEAEVVHAQVERGLARLRRQGRQFNFIFVDPPYGRGEAGGVMGRHSRHEELPERVGPFARMRQTRFGETVIDLFWRREPEDGARGATAAEESQSPMNADGSG